MSSEAQQTTDHDTIRRWTEDRDSHPAAVAASHKNDDAGILRIDFGEPEEGLQRIEWDEFFEKFEESKLAFLYQYRTSDGSTSRFFKFVRR